MGIDKIIIKGAREHNLKNIDIELPRDKFIVMTGLSGSGKSSLAFDTIYAVREDISRACHHMQECSSDRWKSPMSTA